MPVEHPLTVRDVGLSRGTLYIGPPKIRSRINPPSSTGDNTDTIAGSAHRTQDTAANRPGREEFISTHALPYKRVDSLFVPKEGEEDSDSDSEPFLTRTYPIIGTNAHLQIGLSSRYAEAYTGDLYNTERSVKEPRIMVHLFRTSVSEKSYKKLVQHGDLPLLTLALMQRLKEISGARHCKMVRDVSNLEAQMRDDIDHPELKREEPDVTQLARNCDRQAAIDENGFWIEAKPMPAIQSESALVTNLSVDLMNHLLRQAQRKVYEGGTVARKWRYPIQDRAKALHVTISEVEPEESIESRPKHLPVETLKRAGYIIKTSVDKDVYDTLKSSGETYLIDISRRKCLMHFAGVKQYDLLNHDGSAVAAKDDPVVVSESRIKNSIPEENENADEEFGCAPSLKSVSSFSDEPSSPEVEKSLADSITSLSSFTLNIHRRGSAHQLRQLRPSGSTSSLGSSIVGYSSAT